MPQKSLPQFVEPMQASSVKEPFDSPDWIFETKLGGYRPMAVIDSTGKPRLWSRNHLPLESKFPMVEGAVNQLNLRSTILDGEIVALGKDGIPSALIKRQTFSSTAHSPVSGLPVPRCEAKAAPHGAIWKATNVSVQDFAPCWTAIFFGAS